MGWAVLLELMTLLVSGTAAVRGHPGITQVVNSQDEEIPRNTMALPFEMKRANRPPDCLQRSPGLGFDIGIQ